MPFKRTVLLSIFSLFVAVMIGVSSRFYAESVAEIRLESTTFVQCNYFNGVFTVSFSVSALSASGNVLNQTTPMSFTVVASTSYGSTSYNASLTASELLNVSAYFPSSTQITFGSVEVILTGTGVSSGTYTVNCTASTFESGFGGGIRLNPNSGDLINVLFNATYQGKSAISVYGVNRSRGYLIGYFKYETFAPYLAQAPSQNVMLAKVGSSTLYALTSGEFQINVGPDAEGKYGYIIFSSLPAKNIKRGMLD